MARKLTRLLAGCLMVVATAGVAAEENLYSLLEKHQAARGGYDAWKAVTTIRMLGEMSLAEGQTVPVVMEIRRPNLLRFEFELGGQQVIQGYNGKQGWRQMSDGISRELEDMTPEQAREFARTADFDGPLIDWRDKAYSLRYLGLQAEPGPVGHLVEVTRPGGERLNLFLGQSNYLTTVEQVFSVDQPDTPRLSTQLTDYREIAGVQLPFRYDISFLQQGTRQQLVLDSVELNVPMAESRFQKPLE